MKCPNCGKEVTGNFCTYCGTDLQGKIRAHDMKVHYMDAARIINSILFPPAKVMFVIWTVCCIFELFYDTENSFGAKIAIIIAGYIFYCGAADLIYYFGFPVKYLKYRVKCVNKQLDRISDLMDDIAPAQEYDAPAQKAPNYDLMEGHDFEYYCADLLKKNGFINVEVTQGSGDHGIDILADKDGISYAIQCKRYGGNVNNAAVQQAFTGKNLYKKDIAVVLTNQYFTDAAKEEAQSLGVKLWDRDKLNELIGR